jgi:hypothetical protein
MTPGFGSDDHHDSNIQLHSARSGSMTLGKGFTPNPFRWVKSDNPEICPEEDCSDDVIADPSPELIALFHNRAKAAHEQGEDAPAVYKLNIRICSHLKIDQAADNRRCRAKKHGLINVDFQLLVIRVWDLKEVIDPFMSGPMARTNTFIWTNLLDELKINS